MVGEPVGGHRPIVWGVERSKAKKKIYNTCWHLAAPIGGPKHNNQPKTGNRDGGEHGGDMQ
jgi:hypothetical protein